MADETESGTSILGRAKIGLLIGALAGAASVGVRSWREAKRRREPEMELTRESVAYSIPWIRGPGAEARPLGLDTQYGHLVFVFKPENERLAGFAELVLKDLPEDQHFDRNMIVVYDTGELIQELAENMPKNSDFSVVIDGTDEFDRFIKELDEGTLGAS